MFICPKCKKPLILDNKTYRCEDQHAYDVAKKGYVNLLMSQSSRSRHHGDDKLMAAARRDFLSGGFYQPLARALADAAGVGILADIGCGECYYLAYIKDNSDAECVGIDISKEILETAGARTKPRGIKTAVASGAALPFADGSINTLVSVFAPVTEGEFYRVLKKDGRILRVTPGTDHLLELKAAVYDRPRKNDTLDMSLCGFEIKNTQTLRYCFTVSSADAKNLFTMTPYYYKTSQTDREKLDDIDSLDVTAEFVITEYVKLPK